MKKARGIRGGGYRIVWGMLLSIQLVTGAAAARSHPVHRDEGGQPATITVRIYNYAQVSEQALARSVRTAGRVFRNVGIEVSWEMCSPAATGIQQDANCHLPTGAVDFEMRIVSDIKIVRGMTDGRTGGLAIGKLASVSSRRVLEEAAAASIASSELLGLVMAHELGHMLLGPLHSEAGIMQAGWTREDLQHGPHGGFDFTPGQAQLIRGAVRARGQVQFAEDGVNTAALK
jgi:hypothetical protein